jgi:hypothetical protein
MEKMSQKMNVFGHAKAYLCVSIQLKEKLLKRKKQSFKK